MIMKNKGYILFSLIWAILFHTLSGCSVKEDRDSCPCLLTLDLSALPDEGADEILVEGVTDGRRIFCDTLDADAMGRPYSQLLPRGEVALDVYCPASVAESTGGILIEEGAECPQVRMYAEVLDTRVEKISRKVELFKNYCLLDIRIILTSGSLSPLAYKIEGNVNGYEPGGEPSVGPFEVALHPDRKGSCSVALPRQRDASLMLEIIGSDGVSRNFAIGEYIISSGYDWTEPNLQDLSMEIDYAMTRVTLSIDRWSKTIAFNETI